VRTSRPAARAPFAHGRLAAIAILISLTVFLFVKLEFRLAHSNAALYAYGVTVTAVVLTQMAYAILRYRDPALFDHSASAEPPPLVSCMVAVHNEAAIIEQCVRSLAGQSYAAREIIVVDDASTDGTPQILDRLAHEHGIVVIKLERNVGKKRALGAAILAARGGIFAFSDSDSTWAPDALRRAVRILQNNPEVGAISGHCRALNADHNLLTKIQDSWYEGQFSVRKAFESVFGSVSCVSGPLAVFRREAIYNYIPAWMEDRFLRQEFRFATDRMLTAFVLADERKASRLKGRHPGSPFSKPDYGYRHWDTIYSKSTKAWTTVPPNFRGLIKQQVRWKKSFLRNLWFTGGFYWRRPLPVALNYYLHVLFVLAGPFVAFRHLIYMPINGNIESGLLYLAGITLIGSMFALAFRREEPHSTRWVYRPLMSLLSTTVLTWLVFYSIVTIKRMTWSRA
jgi:cellulose synthase/poly-beta-1,6-N-acetylglucosamine synthase-like glycosyltransferase